MEHSNRVRHGSGRRGISHVRSVRYALQCHVHNDHHVI
jgi:hypothetical protein